VTTLVKEPPQKFAFHKVEVKPTGSERERVLENVGEPRSEEGEAGGQSDEEDEEDIEDYEDIENN